MKHVRGFMFDLDGTLVLGDRMGAGAYDVLPGAIETLEALDDRGAPFLILTNGSASPPAHIAAKLRQVGLPIADAQMHTPSTVAADWLKTSGAERVLVLGTPGVGEPLRALGIQTFVPGDVCDKIDAVYVGWHPDCVMRDIEAAANAIWAGAAFTVASNVPFFATKAGKSIGYSRAIAAAVESLTNTPPIVLGKPSQAAMSFVADKLQLPLSDIAVVGDDARLENLMAREAGAFSIGVSTGVTSRAEWDAMPQAQTAHLVLDRLDELLQHL
ncbi:MAG: HAD-IIA family hydrolase [Hyphomonadaceae bacterium]|nr:HAD-IIA family hydrolase [Hyphomonadaceae bacterium]